MLVVHAGPHKTATTYIQNNLDRARNELAGRGWAYPTEGTDGMGAHHAIAHAAKVYAAGDTPERQALAAAGAAAAAKGQSVILSAEGFCRWGPAKLQSLCETFKVDQLDFIYVVRDPFDVFYSYWSEEVKQGYTGSFANRFVENFNDPMASRLLNPMVDLHPLLRTPSLRVRVVPYNLLMARKIDIFSHLCDAALGLPGVEGKPDVARNEAMPLELTEFLRLLTVLKAEGQRFIRSDFRHRFMRMTTVDERREIAKTVATLASGRKRVVEMDKQTQLKVRLEKVLRTRLEGLWTLDPKDDPLFETATRSFSYYNEFDLWTIPQVRKMAEDMMARLAD